MTERIRIRTLVSVEVTPDAIRAAAWLVAALSVLVGMALWAAWAWGLLS